MLFFCFIGFYKRLEQSQSSWKFSRVLTDQSDKIKDKSRLIEKYGPYNKNLNGL